MRQRRTLADREREWAEGCSPRSARGRETAEATAQAICDEFSKISGLNGRARRGARCRRDGRAACARERSVDVRISVNRPLPLEAASPVGRERLGSSPWVGPYQSGFGTCCAALPAEPADGDGHHHSPDQPAMLGALVLWRRSRSDGIAFLAGRLPILNHSARSLGASRARDARASDVGGPSASLKTTLADARIAGLPAGRGPRHGEGRRP